ncbi:unnamed protein product, partial [Effrenium voratum]
QVGQSGNDVLYTYVMDSSGAITLMDETWDGSPEVDVSFPCRSFYRAYVSSKKEENKPEDDAVLSHTGSETNNEDGKGIARRMTRKEARQLDLEIPWRDILEMNDKTRAEYIKAIQKEEASWFAWNGVTPVDELYDIKEIEDMFGWGTITRHDEDNPITDHFQGQRDINDIRGAREFAEARCQQKQVQQTWQWTEAR